MRRLSLDTPFTRFLLVGASNFAASFVVFHLVLALLTGSPRKGALSQACGYTAGVAWSFYWNRRFTFRSTGSGWREGLRFGILQVFLALASTAAVGLAVDTWSFHATASWIVVMSMVTVVNFAVAKHWVFHA